MSSLRKIKLSIIAHKVGPVSTRSPPRNAAPGFRQDTLDAQILATHSFSNAPPLDILLVPGGIGNRVLERDNDTAIEAFIASRYDELKYLLSVCTGASQLATSGVLEGRRATSNKRAWNWVITHGHNVSWVPTARWTQDGKIWTSSGVAAGWSILSSDFLFFESLSTNLTHCTGMDMTYAFLKHVFGEEQPGTIMNSMEYTPHTDPDWDPFSIVWNVSI
ncbi:DJ-1/PfpI family protein [Colletotrichum truncatum]|uniref:DJ-1/PfpI family protein n=1 Tax=Colletotrichum truncatum TaxID=5467 RepID=A0ACC3YNH1_COLTU